MGTITEYFTNLGEYLLAERQKKSKTKRTDADIILTHWLTPLLPAAMRCGPGTIHDIKDRQVGPLDAIAVTDNFPPFSEGRASTYLADGVVFALQIRNWADSDLSQFGEMAHQVQKLERKKPAPMPCLAISFDPMPLPELTQFLKSAPGQAIEGILCVGHHAILRNSKGLYGDPSRIPFLTERPGAAALKAITFYLLRQAQTALNLPLGILDYQHL